MKYYIHNKSNDTTTEIMRKVVDGKYTWIDAINGSFICNAGEEGETNEIIYDTTEDNMRIATMLRDLRNSAGLTTRDMEKIVGISYGNFPKYEKGGTKLSVDIITRLLDAYGYALAVLPKELVK